MPRLIDADKLKADFIFFGNRYYTAQAIEFVIDQQPTVDAEPVIRCKDCKFGEYDEDFPNQYYCPNWGCAFRSDWYCADGERKEDETIVQNADQNETKRNTIENTN